MWYVNELLCRTEIARDRMIMFYSAQGHRVVVKPVPQDQQGRWIIPVNDTMEQ